MIQGGEKLKILNNLKTAKGQIEGIIKMVDEDRYCVDISKQILAVQGLLKKSNLTILHYHVKVCVTHVVKEEHGEEKIEEIFKVILRYAK